jgi:hypothetical protein
MRISSPLAYALVAVAASALVASCSGASPTSLTPGSAAGGASRVPIPLHRHAGDTFNGVQWNGQAHTDHRKSWIAPDIARAPRLYFASDPGTNDVYIYTMPGMSLKGTLTGFNEPQGECADTHGNIYVTNTNSSQVLEYSRTGTLLNTYPDSYGYPVGCAVNPTNGNLAVADIFDFSGAGHVLIYTSPSSQPTALQNPSQYFYYFAAYDSAGDLWVDGKDASGNFILSFCGASSCGTIPLTGATIYFPGAVLWDNTRSQWVVFDQSCGGTSAACSYVVGGSGSLGGKVTYTNYSGGNVCDLIQAQIAAWGHKYVAGGDYEYCGGASSTFNRWGYTGGGNPTNYATAGTYSLPNGAAISTK